MERISRRSEWQGFIKNKDGEIEYTKPLESITYEPTADGTDFIRQAPPTVIRPTKRQKIKRRDRLTLAMGDAQIGYFNDEPFHDETALSLGLVACYELQPDNVVLLGDMIDLAPMSRFEQRSEWQNSTQRSIDRYHNFLSELRANAPNSNIYVISGNHEERMPKMIRRDAGELLGLRRANVEHELGVLTMQYLCRYDELEIKNISGYPNGTLWLEDNLQAIHGTQAKRQGQSAVNYLKTEQASTIFGHDHRLQIAWQTRNTRLGGVACVAASPGCLARTDGFVPGYHFTTDDRGSVVPRSEDWQNGALAIHHNQNDHDVVPLRMNDGQINIFGDYYGTR